jgi:hypothetical protein
MDIELLVDAFEHEGELLDATLRRHPLLEPIFDGGSRNPDVVRRAYLRLLKLKADYVRFTVPALRAAGKALEGGDEEDRAWSGLFLGYSAGETDQDGDVGHHVWALEDMRALDAPRDLIEAPLHHCAEVYARYFVGEANRHPYAILGAKGVLEHFSIRVSDDIVRGVRASKIPNAENAVKFFAHHGVLDIEHVREGDKNLGKLSATDKRLQVLEGAYFTSGIYRSFVRHALA